MWNHRSQPVPLDAADRIRSIRERLGLSPRDFGGRLGLLAPDQTVRSWETGRTRPSRTFWSRVLELEAESVAPAHSPDGITARQ